MGAVVAPENLVLNHSSSQILNVARSQEVINIFLSKKLIYCIGIIFISLSKNSRVCGSQRGFSFCISDGEFVSMRWFFSDGSAIEHYECQQGQY